MVNIEVEIVGEIEGFEKKRFTVVEDGCATLRDLIEELNIRSNGGLRKALASSIEEGRKFVQIWVNEQEVPMQEESRALSEGDKVAFISIPVVAGG